MVVHQGSTYWSLNDENTFIASLCHHPALDHSEYTYCNKKTGWQQRPGNKARIEYPLSNSNENIDVNYSIWTN